MSKPKNKGGKPKGAKDTKPRKQTDKAKVIAKAAKWHVENSIVNRSETVERFSPEYSQGMNETDRYFKKQLAKEVSKLSK